MTHFNLYCTEGSWDVEEDDYQQEILSQKNRFCLPRNNFSRSFTEDQINWEQSELASLLLRGKTQRNLGLGYLASLTNTHDPLASARKEAVQWILSASTHLGFTTQTALLSVSYLDRFLSMQNTQTEKPWMAQLAAVTCLSLAAKVEETRVPFLLDLQVEDTKYVFEARTIKRMEFLVLSALEWRMQRLTPLSFIDHIVRRLGFSTAKHWEFFRRCENLLLSLIIDSRLLHFKPSTVALATMIHVANELDRFNATLHEKELLGFMQMKEDEVKQCLQLIADLAGKGIPLHKSNPASSPSGSPSRVFDVSFRSDSTNDSRASSSSPAAEVLQEKVAKKRRLDDPQHPFSPFNRVVVDILRSPRNL